jgi:hypothetical protein
MNITKIGLVLVALLFCIFGFRFCGPRTLTIRLTISETMVENALARAAIVPMTAQVQSLR